MDMDWMYWIGFGYVVDIYLDGYLFGYVFGYVLEMEISWIGDGTEMGWTILHNVTFPSNP